MSLTLRELKVMTIGEMEEITPEDFMEMFSNDMSLSVVDSLYENEDVDELFETGSIEREWVDNEGKLKSIRISVKFEVK